jgi:predicted esterase
MGVAGSVAAGTGVAGTMSPVGGSVAEQGGAMAGSAAGMGNAGASAGTGIEAGAGGGMADGPMPTMLPPTPPDCPTLATGVMMIGALEFHLWVGARSDAQKGPILIYFHGTGGTGASASRAIPQATIDEVLSEGGIVLSPSGTTAVGATTGNLVWYTGDFDVVDQAVGCAIDQLNIDTRRIYVTGSSAGGLQAGVMAYQRSGYIAASVPDSGGIVFPGQDAQQDPMHLPAVMTLHGAMGDDVVLVDFATQSLVLDRGVVAKGGFAIDCDHGGGHVASPPDLDAAGWQFMKDHPFGVSPWPYAAGLPDSFPEYCVIIE